MAIGSAALAQKITDHANGLSWYPPLVFTPPCRTYSLITIDKPTENYDDDACFEMEAAGFYATASRFSTSELIHCLKIISDNQKQPASKVTEKLVLKLIENSIEIIDQLITQLLSLSNELKHQQAAPKELDNFLAQWHFSQYQKHQLSQLLQRWHALQPEQTPRPADYKSCKKSKDVLTSIEYKLNTMPIRF